nr:ATP-dependent metallopeptidase FtsH/Yme1/Tma family protein [Brevundimonas vesicularis]
MRSCRICRRTRGAFCWRCSSGSGRGSGAREKEKPFGKEDRIQHLVLGDAFIAVIFIQDLIAGWQSVAPISYSQFETYLEDGRVASVAVGSDTITGAFTNSSTARASS